MKAEIINIENFDTNNKYWSLKVQVETTTFWGKKDYVDYFVYKPKFPENGFDAMWREYTTGDWFEYIDYSFKEFVHTFDLFISYPENFTNKSKIYFDFEGAKKTAEELAEYSRYKN